MPLLLSELGKERIRCAGEKIKAEAGLTAQNLDTGFRVIKLDDTNMKDVYYATGEYTQDLLAGRIISRMTAMTGICSMPVCWTGVCHFPCPTRMKR